MRLAALCSTLLSLAVAGATLSVADAQEAAASLPVARIAVHAARLLDVESGRMVADPLVLVEGDKVVSVTAGGHAPAGMQVLERDGILISCSCSHHMPRASLLEGMQLGARHLDRFMQVLEPLSQAPDHPVHPAIPETEYLKGFVTRVLPV